jgi:2-deoxy-D-gluconate 3-dehydrogenase
MDPTPDVSALSLFELHGSNALITGATRGIGAACALALAEAGAKVCLVQRPPGPDGTENKDTCNAIIAAGGSATIIHCDLEDLDQVRSLFPRALEAMGGDIHVLVNCAGIQRRNPAVEFLETDWDDASASGFATFILADWKIHLQVININLKVCWILAQAAGQHMVSLRRGKVINMCSLLTFQGGITVPAYAAAKGALGQLTKALSNEWSQHNVQVNGICPGYIATDM